jgi:serine/threonine protein kinase HipA of HipAB toxin-antitoxin module
MSLQHIRTAVDPELVLKGDVVIIKRTYTDHAGRGQHRTVCTRCSNLFPTELRRMASSGSRALEVRNIPQCRPCRSRYGAARRKLERERKFFAGIDASRVLPSGGLRIEGWLAEGDRFSGILQGGNHPNGWLVPGDRIVTSPIVSREKDSSGREIIQTKSGTTYALGAPA